MERHSFGETHEVVNQTPPLADYDMLAADPALKAALEREGALWHAEALARHGRALTQPDVLALADLANRHEPELSTHSPRGERIDAIEFHPAWHELLALLRREGLHALPLETPRRARMPARCAGYFLHAQLESGSLCPITMTFASIPVLPRTGAVRHVARQAALARARSARPAAGAKALDDDRHGHDRETGRLGRAQQPDARYSDRWRAAAAPSTGCRTQVVFLGAACATRISCWRAPTNTTLVLLLRAALRATTAARTPSRSSA
jgi:hypothetical protein